MGIFNNGCFGGCNGNNSWNWVIDLIIILIALQFLCGIFGNNCGGGCGNCGNYGGCGY